MKFKKRYEQLIEAAVKPLLDIPESVNKGQVQFVDFFAGCGGMSYGFHKIGEKTDFYCGIGSFDNYKHANSTYQRNFGIEPFDIDLGNATVEEIKKCLKINSRQPLVAIGCAPCQGFSSMRRGVKKKDKRNSLVGRFAEIAVGLNADVVIMENVADLITKKHWDHYKSFMTTIENAGYNAVTKIVNMAEYGVPQERFRTVVIASRRFMPTFPKPVLDRSEFITVRNAIEELPPLEAGGVCTTDPLHYTSKHRKETVEILKKIPLNGGSRPRGVGPACLDKVEGFYDVYGRLRWDTPSVTITTKCRTPSAGRFAHPEQNRGLSVREAALLQGFPHDFYFEGPFDDKFKQIGNAVPPLFSLALASHVATMLAGFNRGVKGDVLEIAKPKYNSFSSLIAHIKNSEKKVKELNVV
jgi:DNA (cytosine-5)-methyltransferase 1